MSETVSGRKSAALILAVVAFVTLMDGLDGSIVNVALPEMARSFGTDTGTISWVTITYFVMLAGLLLTFARVSKNGLIKKVLLMGLVLFTASSLFCGISVNFQMLLAFRILQGAGAAMMGAAAPMVCVKYLPASSLGLGMGVLTLGCSIGFAMGPVIGGILTDLLSWHWIFLINIPVGLAATPLLIKAIPKDEGYNGKSLDAIGAALLFSAIMCGVLAIERAPHLESAVPVILAALGCAAFLAAFIAVEQRKDDPLLDLRIFKHWKFNSVLVSYMLANLVYMGLFYLLPFYMSVCLGFSPLTTGMFILISPLLTLVLCVPISKWSDRTERRAFAVASCFVMMVGCIIMVLFAPGSGILPLVATLVSMGLMWALCGGPMASRVIENTEDESKEIGSSVMTQFIYLGGTLGAALFAMFFTFGSGAGNISLSELPPDIFLDGFVFASIAGTAIAAVSIIFSFIVKEPRKVRQ